LIVTKLQGFERKIFSEMSRISERYGEISEEILQPKT